MSTLAGDDDELFDPGDDSDLGIATDGPEQVGLDAAEGPDDGGGPALDVTPTGDQESIRWSEGSDEAGDAVMDATEDFGDGQEHGWTEGSEPDAGLDTGLDGLDEGRDDGSGAATDDRGEEGPVDLDSLLDPGFGQLPPLTGSERAGEDADGLPDEAIDEAETLARGEEPRRIELRPGVRWSQLHARVTTGEATAAATAASGGLSEAMRDTLPPRVRHDAPPLSARLSGDRPGVVAAWPGHILHHRQVDGPWLPRVACADVRLLVTDGERAVAVLCGDAIHHSADALSTVERLTWPPEHGPVQGLHAQGRELLVHTASATYRLRDGVFQLVCAEPLSPLVVVREGHAPVVYGCARDAAGRCVLGRVEALPVRRPVHAVAVFEDEMPEAMRVVASNGTTRLSLQRGRRVRWVEVALPGEGEDDV